MQNEQKKLLILKETVNMNDRYESEILRALQEKSTASIEELAALTFVSASTVRRTLTKMQEKGLLIRTHGGAQLNDETNFFPSFTFRAHQNSLEKKKIALAAIKLVKNGDLIFLDGSTSAFFIAEYLSEFSNVKVVTNGIDTLSLLSKNGVDAYSTGGAISPTNRSVLVGHYAEEMVESLHADLLFFSAQSVTENGEIYDCFEEENVLRKRMLAHSKKSVLLCDATKLEKTASYRLGSLADVDYVVSDSEVAKELDLSGLAKTPAFISL